MRDITVALPAQQRCAQTISANVLNNHSQVLAKLPGPQNESEVKSANIQDQLLKTGKLSHQVNLCVQILIFVVSSIISLHKEILKTSYTVYLHDKNVFVFIFISTKQK